MEYPVNSLILCSKSVVHVSFLFFIFTGYSSFLAFVRVNENLYQRALNVLFCQLAVLYQVHILIEAIGVFSVLWFNVPKPLDILLGKVNMMMALARGLLFIQITIATYLTSSCPTLFGHHETSSFLQYALYII